MDAAHQPRSWRARWQRRAALAAWLAHALLVAKLLGEYSLGVVHFSRGPFVVLLAVIALGTLAALSLSVPARRSSASRWRAGVLGLSTLAPLLAWGWVGFRASEQFRVKQIAPTPTLTLAGAAAFNFAELRVGFDYPHRLESDRLVMYYRDGLPDPAGDLARMDAHVAKMEADIGRPLKAKITWVRGELLGQGRLSTPGFALGSHDDSEDYLDRHELAHAAINQHLTPWTLPPPVLSEGWAVAREESRDTARGALQTREQVAAWSKLDAAGWGEWRESLADPEGIETLTEVHRQSGGVPYLATLTNDFWYHRDRGAVYSIGGGFVDFLLRRNGAKTFAEFYWRVRPRTFAAECEATYGATVAELEREFWADAEARVKK